MRPRHRPIDLSGKSFFLAANGSLVLVRQVGLDLHDRPLFIGGCRVYDDTGNVVALDGRPSGIIGEDLVVDVLYDEQALVPTEVLLAVASSMVEDYVQVEICELEVGEEMTPVHVERAVNQFLSVEPRFGRFRRLLIKSGVRYAIGEELS